MLKGNIHSGKNDGTEQSKRKVKHSQVFWSLEAWEHRKLMGAALQNRTYFWRPYFNCLYKTKSSLFANEA